MDIRVYELSIIPYILCGIYPILILTNESTSLATEDIIVLGMLTEQYDFAWEKNWFIHQVKDDI